MPVQQTTMAHGGLWPGGAGPGRPGCPVWWS